MSDKEVQEVPNMIDENEPCEDQTQERTQERSDMSLIQVCEIYLLHTGSLSLPNLELWVRKTPLSEYLSLRQ